MIYDFGHIAHLYTLPLIVKQLLCILSKKNIYIYIYYLFIFRVNFWHEFAIKINTAETDFCYDYGLVWTDRIAEDLLFTLCCLFTNIIFIKYLDLFFPLSLHISFRYAQLCHVLSKVIKTEEGVQHQRHKLLKVV